MDRRMLLKGAVALLAAPFPYRVRQASRVSAGVASPNEGGQGPFLHVGYAAELDASGHRAIEMLSGWMCVECGRIDYEEEIRPRLCPGVWPEDLPPNLPLLERTAHEARANLLDFMERDR